MAKAKYVKRQRKPRRSTELSDPLARRPVRVSSSGGATPRPTGSASGRRRNRYRVPAVVAWNRRLRTLRNYLLFILLVEGLWLGLTSPLLVVRRVDVAGATVRTSDEIRQIGRLTKPVNIFRAPTRQASKLIKALPEVANVRIERHLPATLLVRVTERTPLASVLTADGCWLMDGSGFVYRSVPAPIPDVPVLMARPTAAINIGKPLQMTAMPAALASLKQVGALPLARNIRFHVEANGDAWLQNSNGLKIRLGQLDDAPERLPLAERMLKGPNGPDLISKLLVLDLTSPDNEFTKRRPEYENFRFAGEKAH